MRDNVIKIMCPKCMESSDYELPNDIMLVKRDDFTTDLLNQGVTRGYQKGRADTIRECIDKIEKFAECNEECSKKFYYGQGCNACMFGKIKASIRGEKGENN